MIAQKARVLITCKTYPQPSLSHKEVVCTAGLREDGSFIRLYPINFRELPSDKQFSKYAWIEVELEKRLEDPRPESFRPKLSTLEIGETLNTSNNWANRNRVVLSADIQTMCALSKIDQHVQSLGLIKPMKIDKIYADECDPDWSPQHQALLSQLNLFGERHRPLEKVPFVFRIRYKCQDVGCRGHDQSIIDWEIYALYRKLAVTNDPNSAVAKVIDKYSNDIFSDSRDLYFFVGTVLEHNSWLIIGTFYPPHVKQMSLFDSC